MKSALFFLISLFSSSTCIAQVYSNNPASIGMRPNPVIVEKTMSNSTTDQQNHHLLLKRQIQSNPSAGSRGGGSLDFAPIGTSANAFTVLDGAVNCVASVQATNSVTFIHRANVVVNPNVNSAQFVYDISKNGGNNWNIDLGPLTPTLENFDIAGRFPQVTLYNPIGNTDADESYLVYYGTWLPYGGTGNARTWDGVVTGVAKTDNNPISYTENITSPNNGDINVAKSLVNGLPGEFWAVNFSSVPLDSSKYDDILVSRGIWNNTTKDVVWTHNRLNVPFITLANGGIAVATVSIAFDPSGINGWIAFLGDVSPDADATLNPIFYKTTNGGDNWTGPIEVKLSDFANVIDGLNSGSLPTAAFDADLVVDAYGNPHYSFVVGASSSPYSIDTDIQGLSVLKIYDVNYTSGCQWQAIFIDTISTLRGTLSSGGGTSFSEDNRPQMSRSEDGNIVFIGWSDSDASLTGGENTLPDFKGKMLNVQNNLATAVINFTENDATWAGSALLPSVSPTLLVNGNTINVPTVFLEFNTVSGNATDPAQFYYIKDIAFGTNDFIHPFGNYIPVIDLSGTNPQYIYLGEPYTELGATADDCSDGDLTSTIIIDVSGVNTNVRDTSIVFYTAVDSDNNTVTKERQVIVNTEPESHFGYSFGGGLMVQFRDSSIYNPTIWQWNFGDGSGSPNRNPVKVYAEAGSYNVCLTARNNFNSSPFNKPSNTTCKTVHVGTTSIPCTSIPNISTEGSFFPEPENLNCIIVNQSYSETIFFKNFGAVSSDVSVISTRFDSIHGLPSGLSWSVNVPQGNPNNTLFGSETGCIFILGTTNAAPGIYNLDFSVTMTINLLGQTQVISDRFSVLADLFNNSFGTLYNLDYNLTVVSNLTDCNNTQLCNLLVSGNVTNATVQGAANGTVSITLSNGTAPYTYAWSNGATTKNLTNIEAGNYTVTITDNNECSASQTFIVYNDIVSSFLSDADAVSIYPNPTAGEFVVIVNNQNKLEKYSIKIYDTQGKIVFENKLSEKENKFSLQEIPQGMYLIKIETASGNINRRLVKY